MLVYDDTVEESMYDLTNISEQKSSNTYTLYI